MCLCASASVVQAKANTTSAVAATSGVGATESEAGAGAIGAEARATRVGAGARGCGVGACEGGASKGGVGACEGGAEELLTRCQPSDISPVERRGKSGAGASESTAGIDTTKSRN